MNRQRVGAIAEILLDYVEHNRTFRTDKIMTVPAGSYTDPDQWRAEIDLIFKRVPLMLALTCEMPKPGDYKAMEIVGLPVLMARDKAGTVRAFLNVCAHRWAPVAAEGHGNCSRFICPYHGWTYGTDGKLISIADNAKFGDVDKSTHGLTELPCEERHGMIFVCLTQGLPLDLNEYYGALLDDYAYAGFKDFNFIGSRELVGANWKIALNGFLEGYHFATLHPKTVFPNSQSNVTYFEGFGPHMRNAYPNRNIAKLREVPREQWEKQENECFGFLRAFFPNVIAFLSPELTVFNQILPGPTPDKNRLVILYARKDPLKDEAELADITENKMKIDTYNEDYGIGRAIQKGLESGAREGLLYGQNERGNQYFHEWVNWYLQGDPALPKPVM